MGELAREQVRVDDLTFDVAATGHCDDEHALPVLLLHGFPQDADSWSGVVPRLVEAGLAVLTPDQRGYSPGARPEEVADYALDRLARDVLGIAAAYGHKRFHLVGHDWGASVAWYLAAHHPSFVASLTAVSVPHLAAYGWALREDAAQREQASYIALFRQPGRAEDLLLAEGAGRLRAMYGDDVPADRIDGYVHRLQAPGAMTAALSWYRAMSADLASLPPVTVATTYVWGEDDIALGRAGAERCGQHVTGDYRFVPVPGVGHWVPEQAPDLLADAIIERVQGTS